MAWPRPLPEQDRGLTPGVPRPICSPQAQSQNVVFTVKTGSRPLFKLFRCDVTSSTIEPVRQALKSKSTEQSMNATITHKAPSLTKFDMVPRVGEIGRPEPIPAHTNRTKSPPWPQLRPRPVKRQPTRQMDE